MKPFIEITLSLQQIDCVLQGLHVADVEAFAPAAAAAALRCAPCHCWHLPGGLPGGGRRRGLR